jgi:hypothetical protein
VLAGGKGDLGTVLILSCLYGRLLEKPRGKGVCKHKKFLLSPMSSSSSSSSSEEEEKVKWHFLPFFHTIQEGEPLAFISKGQTTNEGEAQLLFLAPFHLNDLYGRPIKYHRVAYVD